MSVTLSRKFSTRANSDFTSWDPDPWDPGSVALLEIRIRGIRDPWAIFGIRIRGIRDPCKNYPNSDGYPGSGPCPKSKKQPSRQPASHRRPLAQLGS